MKAENLPIKVECFRVRERNQLEPIGYYLIPLRIIPTCLYKNDEIVPSPRWYKLMGVPNDILCNKPQIHLNVIIQPEQECLSATHLRGKFDDDEGDVDDSYAEPDMANHFELKMSEEEEVEVEVEVDEKAIILDKKRKEVTKIPKPTPTIEITEPVNNNNNKNTEKDESNQYVKKLEDWKKEEKENFVSHLKKVENTFLESMFEEWQRKKHEEENKLKATIEECERLSRKLEDGYAQMRQAQRTEQESQALVMSQAVLQEEVALERRRSAALEVELREERDDNKVLRNRVREMERDAAQADEEMNGQIVSN